MGHSGYKGSPVEGALTKLLLSLCASQRGIKEKSNFGIFVMVAKSQKMCGSDAFEALVCRLLALAVYMSL